MRIPKAFANVSDFFDAFAQEGYTVNLPKRNGGPLRYIKVSGESGVTVAYVLPTRIDFRLDASDLPRLTKAQSEKIHTRDNPRSGLAVVLSGPTEDDIPLALKLARRAERALSR